MDIRPGFGILDSRKFTLRSHAQSLHFYISLLLLFFQCFSPIRGLTPSQCVTQGVCTCTKSMSDTSCRVFSVLFSFLAFLHERRYPTSFTYLWFLYDYVSMITILVGVQNVLDVEGECLSVDGEHKITAKE